MDPDYWDWRRRAEGQGATGASVMPVKTIALIVLALLIGGVIGWYASEMRHEVCVDHGIDFTGLRTTINDCATWPREGMPNNG